MNGLRAPVVEWSDAALEEQFVSIRHEFIRQRGLAQLWHADGGLAISALPVMWLLGRGYPEGLSVSQVRLAWLSGISRRSARRAVTTLAATALLREVKESANSVRYALSGTALWKSRPEIHGDRKTHFPGRIVASGLWRSLRRAERATLLALTGVVSAAEREGVISCSGVSELTGIDRASASRAMRALSKPTLSARAPVALVDSGQDGVGFYLTAEWWDL